MFIKLKTLSFTLLILVLGITKCPAMDIHLSVKNDADHEMLADVPPIGDYFRFYPFSNVGIHDSLNEFLSELELPKKPPTLFWKYEDSLVSYYFEDKGMNNRLIKWIKSGWEECLTSRINPDLALKATSFSCMEFAFFVSGNVRKFSPNGTADLQLEDVGEEDLDEHAKVGDVFILKVSNEDREPTSSFAGHTLIYAGNDHFLSAEIDGNIYFQSIEQIKLLWAEPGEGVYGVRLKLLKVKKSSIVEDETRAKKLLGSTPEPVKTGVKEPPSAMSKADREKKKADKELHRIRKYINTYSNQKREERERPSYINYVTDQDHAQIWQNIELDSLLDTSKKAPPQIPPFMLLPKLQ